MNTYNTVDGVEARLLIDERVNLDQSEVYVIEKPASYVRYHQNISTNYDDSSVQFSVIPPNKNIAVDKRMYLTMEAQITWTGDAGIGNFLMPSYTHNGSEFLGGETDALRFLPLQSVTESLSFTFNQSTVSQNLSDYVEALSRIGTDKDWSDSMTAPTMHDSYQSYSDFTKFGTAKNPLAMIGENSAQAPRGAFQIQLSVNTQFSAVGIARWSEPILLSPLLFKRLWQEEKAFIGLTNIDITFNLGNLSRMLCHDAVNNPVLTQAPTVSLSQGNVAPPEIRLCFLTPNLSTVIPRFNHYPYYEINRYPTTGGPVAAGASTTISGNNVQLSSVPKRAIVFLKRRKSDQTYLTSDTYARIDRVNLNFQNKNALLGSAKTQDLFSMSRRNGLRLSYPEWHNFGQVGSVCVIDFGKDISLDEDEATGSYGQYQFQIDIDYTNLSEEQITYQLWTVIISEGVFTLEDTQSFLNVGSVLPKNIQGAKSLSELERVTLQEAHDMTGGSFWSSLKKMAKKAARGAKKAAHWAQETGIPMAEKAIAIGKKHIPQAIGMLEKFAPLLLAAGYSEGEVMDIIEGRGLKAGGLVAGGRTTSRRSLRNRM